MIAKTKKYGLWRAAISTKYLKEPVATTQIHYDYELGFDALSSHNLSLYKYGRSQVGIWFQNMLRLSALNA